MGPELAFTINVLCFVKEPSVQQNMSVVTMLSYYTLIMNPQYEHILLNTMAIIAAYTHTITANTHHQGCVSPCRYRATVFGYLMTLLAPKFVLAFNYCPVTSTYSDLFFC